MGSRGWAERRVRKTDWQDEENSGLILAVLSHGAPTNKEELLDAVAFL